MEEKKTKSPWENDIVAQMIKTCLENKSYFGEKPHTENDK